MCLPLWKNFSQLIPSAFIFHRGPQACPRVSSAIPQPHPKATERPDFILSESKDLISMTYDLLGHFPQLCLPLSFPFPDLLSVLQGMDQTTLSTFCTPDWLTKSSPPGAACTHLSGRQGTSSGWRHSQLSGVLNCGRQCAWLLLLSGQGACSVSSQEPSSSSPFPTPHPTPSPCLLTPCAVFN